MAASSIAENAVSGHGRRRLDHNDAVKNQVPKRERSSKSQGWGRGGPGWSGCHSRVLDYVELGDVND